MSLISKVVLFKVGIVAGFLIARHITFRVSRNRMWKQLAKAGA